MKEKILLLSCLLTSTAFADSVSGELYNQVETKTAVVVNQLDNAKVFSFAADEFSEIKSAQPMKKDLPVVGAVLSSESVLISGSNLDWQITNSVASAEIIVELTDIEAFRAGLEGRLLSSATAVYAFQPDDREATWTKLNLSDGIHWLPTFTGNQIGFYIESNPENTNDITVFIPQILNYSATDLEMRLKNTDQQGNSQSCEVNVVCNNSGFESVQNSVAKYIFVSGGYGYLCTGSLINDLDNSTQIPYFATAGHCVSTNSEAASMELYWNFQTASCNGSTLASNYTSRSGGATLKTAQSISENSDIGVKLDYSLLVLNDNPPNGVYLSGWASSFQSAGINITGIHHPAGDVKKISKGLNLGSSGNGHYGVRWTNGVTEGGSSGSGIWNDSLELIGVLSGGSSSCSNKSGTDVYTSFDSFYPYISQYIGVTGGTNPDPEPSVNTLDKRFSGAWYNRDRAGEGWLIEMLVNNRINAYWFTYDDEGDPLYIFGAGNYDPSSASVTLSAYTTEGPIFGDSYNKANLIRNDWGTMTFSFTDCYNATFSYSSPLTGYGSGTRNVTRLSVIDGTGCLQ